MKKFLRYSLMLVAAVLVFSSCKNEEDMIFDDSAANRLDISKGEFFDLLCSNGGKWEFEYFSNTNEPGYVYVMSFTKDQQVKMAANNQWIGNSYNEETSLWNVITDDGVVLTFNSYNSIFHLFSDPDNYDDGGGVGTEDSSVDHTGRGHEGDYEFIFINVSEDGNTITLKGKKRGYYHYLRRLAPDTDDQSYVQAVVDQQNNLFAPKIKNAFLTLSTGERFIVNYTKGVVSAYPEGGDAITQTSKSPCILTLSGLRFLNPFAISRAANPNDSIYVQNFVLQPNGTLLCTDLRDAVISVGPLGEFIVAGNTWRVDYKNATGDFAKLNDAAEEVKAQSGTFQNADFVYDAANSTLNLLVTTRIKVGKQNVNAKLNFRYDYELLGDNIKLTYRDCDNAAANYGEKMPSLQSLVEQLDGATLALTAPNRLSCTKLTITLGASQCEASLQ